MEEVRRGLVKYEDPTRDAALADIQAQKDAQKHQDLSSARDNHIGELESELAIREGRCGRRRSVCARSCGCRDGRDANGCKRRRAEPTGDPRQQIPQQ